MISNKYYKLKEDVKIIKVKVDSSSSKIEGLFKTFNIINKNVDILNKHVINLQNKVNDNLNKNLVQQLSVFEKQIKVNAKSLMLLNKSLININKNDSSLRNKLEKKIKPNIIKLKKSKEDVKKLPEDANEIIKIIHSNLENIIKLKKDVNYTNDRLVKLADVIGGIKLPTTLQKNKMSADKLTKSLGVVYECVRKNPKNIKLQSFIYLVSSLRTLNNQIINISNLNLDKKIKETNDSKGNVNSKSIKSEKMNTLTSFSKVKIENDGLKLKSLDEHQKTNLKRNVQKLELNK